MKKIVTFLFVLTLIICCLVACDNEYYCDLCQNTYNDGSCHYVCDDSVDMTLCDACYSKYMGNEASTENEIITTDQAPTSPTETYDPKEESEPPSELFCDLSEISVWTDVDGEFYVYVKAWDAYRKMSGLKDWNKLSIIIDPTSAIISEKTGAIAVICQSGKSDTVITTYHFNVENDNVEVNTALLETEVHCELNYHFINLYNQDCGYFFFMPQSLDSHTSVAWWPLIRYETTDGGKTWKETEIYNFDLSWHKYPTITKFISYRVGIIGFRYQGAPNDLWNRTYITTDGGLTWNKISNLPSPYDDIVRYSEVLNFEQADDGYVLTVEVRDLSYSEIIQFRSDDLMKWLCITSVSNESN